MNNKIKSQVLFTNFRIISDLIPILTVYYINTDEIHFKYKNVLYPYYGKFIKFRIYMLKD